MARTKATVGRLSAAAESNFQRRMVRLFKIKEILPQQKTVSIKKNKKTKKKNKQKKNGRVIKTINVRRKSRYFSGRKWQKYFKINAELYQILFF